MSKNIVKKINANSTEYFLERLQEYNYLINEKAQKLSDFQAKIKENSQKQREKFDTVKQGKDIKEQEEKEYFKKIKEYELQEQFKSMEVAEYRENTFFQNYRELQKTFDIDREKIILEFIQKHQDKKEEQKYNILIGFKEKFNQEAIYEMLLLTSEEQLNIVKDVMNEKEKQMINLDSFVENKKHFTIIKLLNYLTEEIRQIDPTIYVYVGNRNYNYDYIDKRIKTKIYKNMIEGIIIKYKEKIYDYSI
jgi:hypothetical protein